MGEYAFRKSDGERIKIGTCESMYYIRYEDRNKVRKATGSLDPAQEINLFWRIPFPDEDEVPIGEYEDYSRGIRLCKPVLNQIGEIRYWEDFTDPDTEGNPGTIELRHEASGLLLNVKCYHGSRLPEVGPEAKAFWNGKGHSLELTSVKNQDGVGLRPVVRCRHCQKMWRYEWTDVLPFVPDDEMRKRLERYTNE